MNWKERHTLNFPTSIRFGAGVSDELGDYLKDNAITSVLIVTDPLLAGIPFLKSIIEQLGRKGISTSLFHDIDKNPVKSNVMAGKATYQSTGAQSIVAIGGGASMDVARAIALAANHERDLFDFDDALGGDKHVENPIPHFVCLPTTSGTGSEVGRSAVISEDATKKKRILFSPHLMARMVFADPMLTMDLPSRVTSTTGMDALTHNTEAFVAKGFNPLCDGIALEGVKLVADSLVKATKAPDLESRSKMMMASLMGATAFQKGLGVVHSCAHPLSTKFDIHHGLANALMLEHGVEFNQPEAGNRYNELAKAIGRKTYLDWLKELKQELELPSSLAQLGVNTTDIEELSDLAMADPCHQNNPRPCCKEDFKNLYLKALK